MRKNTLIKNTFLLILGGFITKILGFIIKILYTRILKAKGVGLITIIFPTYSLMLTISSFALPLAVTKLTSERKYKNSSVLFNAFFITMFINTIIISLFFIYSNKFSIVFLHNKNVSFLLKILCITLPFVSVTSLIKSYFFGKENVIPIILSNILEEIIKLLMIIFYLPSMVNKGILYGTSFYLFINLLCEIFSFVVLFLFLPNKVNIKNIDYKYDKSISNSLLKISVPTISSRIIGSIGYFFEPIILTNLLLYKGLKSNYILLNYGYFQGYVIQLLTIPSFFLTALSNNIIPAITKHKINKDYQNIKKIITKILFVIVLGGLLFIILLTFFGKKLMIVLFKSTNGYIYLKILLPFFILFYIESPLFSFLQSLDQEKKVLKITTIGTIIKYLSLIILILLNIGFISLIYSEIINIILVVSLSIYYLIKYFSYLSQ